MSRKPELKGRAARFARLFPAGPRQAARTPFVLLVVLLLGGGLIGLLVLNSALSEGSFKMDDLQRDTKSLTDEEQALQRDIDSYSAPDALQRRASELGMIPGGDPAFLDPDGTVKGVPTAAALRPTQDAAVRPPEAITLSQTIASPPPPAPSVSPVPNASPAPGVSPVPGSAPLQSAAPVPTAATPTTPGR
ncbi:septum formation initiator family protein [Streptomyces sp. NBC_01275]|uniref:septum formation initiator family protein n=1 Tax=Streptomyces sp. NBC_01275 TaxID=2903807 RepID=UPI002250CAA7|nr:septum formation initiator family protein [Streptomyces sp. NBC_01275]MCX4761324.1 septum formation initiator family protein [Streptomyces sp. NBC_01275]